MAGLNPPKWLAYQAPDSHPLALTTDEFRRLVQHAFAPSQRHLADERDVFVLQTLLLLRDSDMRRLRPGYVKEMGLLLGQPAVLVASMPQKKTREPFTLPFCELAGQLWRLHPAGLPVVVQQNRDARMKDMAAAVGLMRKVMKVRWVGKQPHETALPLCQALTSHAARHTSADPMLAGRRPQPGGNCPRPRAPHLRPRLDLALWPATTCGLGPGARGRGHRWQRANLPTLGANILIGWC